MNIKSCFEKIIKELDQFVFSDMSHIDKKQIVNSLRITINDIRVYSKPIEPKSTEYYELLINNIIIDELVITSSMINEAFIRFKSLKKNVNNVKLFINQYFLLLEFLLVFNISEEECCDLCQGYLFYYFDEENILLLKECNTCGAIYDALNSKAILIKDKISLKMRPAKKEELKSYIN